VRQCVGDGGWSIRLRTTIRTADEHRSLSDCEVRPVHLERVVPRTLPRTWLGHRHSGHPRRPDGLHQASCSTQGAGNRCLPKGGESGTGDDLLCQSDGTCVRHESWSRWSLAVCVGRRLSPIARIQHQQDAPSLCKGVQRQHRTTIPRVGERRRLGVAPECMPVAFPHETIVS
jgi:hypothetical protein